jgi:hypothetical protein
MRYVILLCMSCQKYDASPSIFLAHITLHDVTRRHFSIIRIDGNLNQKNDGKNECHNICAKKKEMVMNSIISTQYKYELVISFSRNYHPKNAPEPFSKTLRTW